MFSRLILATVASTLLFVGAGLNFFEKPEKIDWKKDEINSTVFGGGSRTIVARFTSNKNLSNANVFITPSIDHFVRVSSSVPLTILKGENSLGLTIVVPSDSAKKILRGTLHIRSGKQTISEPLKIEIKVMSPQDLQQKLADLLIQQFGTVKPLIPANQRFLLASSSIEVDNLFRENSNLPYVFQLNSVDFLRNLAVDSDVQNSIPDLITLAKRKGIRTDDIAATLPQNTWHRDELVNPVLKADSAVTLIPGLTPYDSDGNGIADMLIDVSDGNTHIILRPTDAEDVSRKNFLVPTGISEPASTVLHELSHVLDFRTFCGGNLSWFESDSEESFVQKLESFYIDIFATISRDTQTLNTDADILINQFPNTQSCLGLIDLTRPVAVHLNNPIVVSSTAVNLSWSQNSDRDFESYRIYRLTTPGVSTNSLQVATSTDKLITTFTDYTIAPNTTYFYKVFVFDKAGLSRGSNEVSTFPTTPPGQPGPNVGDFVLLPMLVNGIRGGSLTNLDMMGNSKAVAIGGIGEVSAVAVPQGTIEHIASLTAQPYADTVSSDGHTIYILSNPGTGAGPGQIDKVDLITKATSSVDTSNTFHNNFGGDITITPDQLFLIATFGSGGTVSVNIKSHNVQAISAYGGTGIAIEPGGQTALVSASFGSGLDQGDGLIRINLSNGQGTLVRTLPSTPTDVAISPDGTIAYVSTFGGIFQIVLQPSTIQSVSSQNCLHIDIKADGTGLVCIGDNPSDFYLISLPGGTVSTLNRTIFAPSDFVKETDTTLLIADTSCTSFSGISRYDMASTITERISDPICQIAGMESEPNTSNLIIGSNSGANGFLARFNTATNHLDTVASDPSHLGDVNLNSDGHTVLATDGFQQNVPGSLVTLDLASTTPVFQTLFTGFISPAHIEIGRANNVVYVMQQGATDGELTKINLNNNATETILDHLRFAGDVPVAIAFEDSTHVLIGAEGKLIRVNISTHATSIIAQDFCALSNNGLKDILIEEGGQTALVSNSVCGMVRVRIK